MENNGIVVLLNRDEKAEIIKYVAYTFTNGFYVFIDIKNNKYSINLVPKNGNIIINKIKLEKEFLLRLKEEKKRYEIYKANKGLRDFLIKKAILGEDKQENNERVLTPEEEKELESIIKEVENELKLYKKKDFTNISKTWEETHAQKRRK